MQTGKLNPTTVTASGVTTPVARLQFPGFQKIMDFTSAGSESSTALTVDSDTDKEYRIVIRNLNASYSVSLRLNNDSGSNYGYQNLFNNNGSVSASRSSGTSMNMAVGMLGEQIFSFLAPTGFIKTLFLEEHNYVSTTSITQLVVTGFSYNSTSNITSLNFFPASGDFTSGTRIIVYARRAQ